MQRTNRPFNILKFALLNLAALVVAVLFWPYAVAGACAWGLSGMRFNRWVSAGAALALVVVWRTVSGEWNITIGEPNHERWYFEISPGIASWAFATLFVSAFAQWPAEFMEGYRSRLKVDRVQPM